MLLSFTLILTALQGEKFTADMSVFRLISFVNAEKTMQKPLTVTECKWMLI